MKNMRTCKIDGRTYEIPDIWIAGFCHRGASPADAVRYWHEQALMGEQWEREHAEAD